MLETYYRNLCHNFSFTGDFILLFYFSQYTSFHSTYSRSYHFAVMIKDIITEHSDNITHISIYSHSRQPRYPPGPDRLLCVNPQFLCDISFSMQRFPNEETCSGTRVQEGTQPDLGGQETLLQNLCHWLLHKILGYCSEQTPCLSSMFKVLGFSSQDHIQHIIDIKT